MVDIYIYFGLYIYRFLAQPVTQNITGNATNDHLCVCLRCDGIEKMMNYLCKATSLQT